MNKSVLLCYKQAILPSWTRVKQELEFKIFGKIRAGAVVKLFEVGVELELKNLNSGHLW